MKALLSLLLAALPAAAAAQTAVSASWPRALPAQRDWGQGSPAVLGSIFEKVVRGAQAEKWAREDQGFFSRVLGRLPEVDTKVQLEDGYLIEGSPALAEERSGADPVVRVGRSALDSAQSEGEMAFLLGHELHHTLVKKRKNECYRRGAARLGGGAMVKRAPETEKYQRDLEREADAWGQRYMANAGYNPLAAVDAIRHVYDLSEAWGYAVSADEHDVLADREAQLKAYGSRALFEARCQWPAE